MSCVKSQRMLSRRDKGGLPSGWDRIYSVACSTIVQSQLKQEETGMVSSKLTAVDSIGLLIGYLNAEFLVEVYE